MFPGRHGQRHGDLAVLTVALALTMQGAFVGSVLSPSLKFASDRPRARARLSSTLRARQLPAGAEQVASTTGTTLGQFASQRFRPSGASNGRRPQPLRLREIRPAVDAGSAATDVDISRRMAARASRLIETITPADSKARARYKAGVLSRRNAEWKMRTSRTWEASATANDTTSTADAVTAEERCRFPNFPQLCTPLTVKHFRSAEVDMVESAVVATGARSSCKVPELPRTPLTQVGERTKVIVFVALGGGDVCEQKTHDWRARLPGFLGEMANATAISWLIRFNSCFTCTDKGPVRSDCVEQMQGGVDLLVVLGSGHLSQALPCFEMNSEDAEERFNAVSSDSEQICASHFTDLWHLMHQDWAQNAMMKIHFPIRRMPQVMENRLFNFDLVIDDASFNKPPSSCTTAVLNVCKQNKSKGNNLIYIGRLNRGKGQLAFIESINPQLMDNHTLHMYGTSSDSGYRARIRRLARKKGIAVMLHGEVGKGRLYAGICSAIGMIHYAEDKNPRSVYEVVQAGIPILVNKEAQISPELEREPFVVVTEPNDKSDLNNKFADFLRSTRQDWSRETAAWSGAHLREEAVYRTLCERMCICSGPATSESCGGIISSALSRTGRELSEIPA